MRVGETREQRKLARYRAQDPGTIGPPENDEQEAARTDSSSHRNQEMPDRLSFSLDLGPFLDKPLAPWGPKASGRIFSDFFFRFLRLWGSGKGIAGGVTEIGAVERRSPSPILIILGGAFDFIFLIFFLSLSLHALGHASGVRPTQSFKSAPSNNLFNAINRRPGGPQTSAGRKDGGLLSFTFWLFMSISVTSLTQSTFPSPVYALLGLRSMVYATVCFVAVLVFGQSHPFRFLGRSNISLFSQTFEHSLIVLRDHAVFRSPIAEDLQNHSD